MSFQTICDPSYRVRQSKGLMGGAFAYIISPLNSIIPATTTYIKLTTQAEQIPHQTQCSHQSLVLSSSSPEHPSSLNQPVQHLSNSARSPPVHPVHKPQAAHSPTCPSRAHTATRCLRGDTQVNQDSKSCTLMKLAVLELVYVPPLFSWATADEIDGRCSSYRCCFQQGYQPQISRQGCREGGKLIAGHVVHKADMFSLEKISRQTRLRTMTEPIQMTKLARPTSHSTHRRRRLESKDRDLVRDIEK